MIRLLDILFALLGLLVSLPILLLLVVIGFFDTGAPIFMQQRVGKYGANFTLIKFRTMKRDTADVASHLASASSVTRFGSFLRKTKLDELPQLWNVLKGDMSLVGPRPGLPNQLELTAARQEHDVYSVRPGITGLAQINHIDMSTPKKLAEVDGQMIATMSISNYCKYILLTLLGKGSGDRISSSK